MNPGTAFTREEKLKARTLYLVKGWSVSEIAEKLGKLPTQVTKIAYVNGWTKQRRQAEEKAAARAEQSAILNAEEFMETVAIRGEEQSMGGFDLADSARASGDALAFSAAMSGTKTAVALTRQALGIDSTTAGAVNISLNAVFARPISEPRRVDPLPPEALNAAQPEDLDFA